MRWLMAEEALPMPVSLLETKLFAPPSRQHFVSRPAVTAKLHASLFHPLTLIAAPAGFGKTTLVSEWIAEHSLAAAWLSLDDDDNDLIRFLTYLIAALQTQQPQLGVTVQALLIAPQMPPIKAILTLLLNELRSLSAPMALVLDDYHQINRPEIHDALAFLVDHLPPSFHLVITTRIDPPLPLARWRVRNQLAELRANDLRFHHQEIATFFNEMMGLTLTADELATLELRTEGWIAGLQLAALSLQGRSDVAGFIQAFSGSHRHVLSYLVEEVLNRCPAEVIEFLYHTSLLERLTVSLCNAVTGRSDSLQLLRQLEHSNLFLIALDDDGKWYRYHHLFAEVLRSRLLETEPGMIQRLQQRASLWYEEEELWPEAIHHALAKDDFARAADLIERIGITLFAQTNIQHALNRWLSTLPLEVIHQRPRLCLIYAWICIDRRDMMAASQFITTAEATLQRHPPAHADDPIYGEVAAMHARLLVGIPTQTPTEALAWGQKALSILRADQATFRCIAAMAVGHAYVRLGDVKAAEHALAEAERMGRDAANVYLYVSAAANHAIMQRALGWLRLAQATCQEALAWVTQRNALAYPIVGGLYLNLADLLREQNDLTTAQGYVEIAVARTNQELNLVTMFVLSRLVLLRLKQAQGEWPAVWELLHEVSVQVEAHPGDIHDTLLSAMRAQFRVAQGTPSNNAAALMEAVTWAHAVPWQEGMLLTANRMLDFIYLCEHSRIARAQVLLAWARSAHDEPLLRETLAYLERQWLVAKAASLRWLQIKVKLLQALIYYALTEQEQAWAALTLALHLAQPEAYTRVFIDEGEPMRQLLLAFRLWAGRHASSIVSPDLSTYVSDLLTHFGGAQATVETSLAVKQSHSQRQELALQHLTEPLSDRELEVLRLVVTGLSNSEIAMRLIISLSTVKTHINRIFGKLAVQSRMQATARARALGLCD